MAFDPVGWRERIDLGAYPDRAAMLDDLLERDTLDGISHAGAVQLLGAPDGYDGSAMWYQIVVEYDWVEPESGRNLILLMNTDSSIARHYVQEWHH